MEKPQQATRQPLSDIQNKPPSYVATKSTSLKSNDQTSAIKRTKSMIGKPTLPSRRRTVASRSSSEANAPAPNSPPPRRAAKPKPLVNAPGLSRLQKDERRMTSASIAFTAGQAPSRTGITGGSSSSRNDHFTKLDQIRGAQTLLLQKMDNLGGQLPVVNSNSSVGPDDMREQFERMREQLDQLMKNQIQSETQGELINRVMRFAEENAQLKLATQSELKALAVAERKFEDAKEELEASNLENERLTMQVEDLQQKVAKFENSNGNNSLETQRLQTQLENLHTELRAVQISRDSVLGTLENMKRNVDAQNMALSTRDSTIAEQRTKLSSMSVELQDKSHQLEEAESVSSKCNVEMRRIERERDAFRIELDDLKCEMKDKLSSLRQAEGNVMEARSRIDQLMREKDLQIQNTANKIRSASEDTDAKLRLMGEERDVARVAVKRLESEVSSGQAQVASLTEAVTDLQNRATRLSADKATQALQLNALREDNERLREQNRELMKTISEQGAEMEALQVQAREDARHRRKLHNMIQELKGNIRVFCRIRPLLSKEVEAGGNDLFEYTEKGQGIVAKGPMRDDGKPSGTFGFKFDKVFDPSCSQSTVFEEISELVQSALDGYRVCIFAYGQTGSGKTYTMLGQRGDETSTDLGMIPRAVRQVFDSAKAMERDDWTFTLRASFLEIYNEGVRDLLGDSASKTSGRPSSNGNGGPDHKITFNTDTKLCTVSDINIVDVTDEEQVQRLIERSMRNRATAATRANDRSSRSHSVFRLHIVGRNASTGQELGGLLNLIDLAGSERLTQSRAEGDRLRETRHINKSLSALGDVIAALANREKHVPFRNSKLTHLLQDSLGGDCKTLMFVNVSHAAESFNESVCSLRFASKVNSCHVGTARRIARIDLQ